MTANLFVALTFTLLTSYLSFLLYVQKGWRAIQKDKITPKKDVVLDFSIVVPFRNEIDHIEAFLKSFDHQQYPKDHFELILVDDHSDDITSEFIKTYQSQTDMIIRLFELPRGLESKKAAIEFGVRNANAAYIVSTDVDTIRKEDWLTNLSERVASTLPDLLILPVLLKSESDRFLSHFQQMEFSILQFIGFGFAGNENAILCNGANLVYRKDAFVSSDAYKDNRDIPSGDDLFLLQQFKNRGCNIQADQNPDLLVHSEVERTFRAVLNQKARWAGKLKKMKNLNLMILGLLSMFSWLYCPLAVIFELIYMQSIIISSVFIVLKFIMDHYMLRSVNKHFEQTHSYWGFAISFLLYPFYYFPILIMSLFGRSDWKGRTIRN